MYITDLRDLYKKANDYFGSRGRCQSIDSRDGTVQLLLYGSEVFYLGAPSPPWTSLSFQYEVGGSIRSQEFFGVRLSMVENVKEDIENAFAVIENFARLRLSDKYLAMWESSAS